MHLKKYVGDRSFYRMVMTVALPITIQNGISTFVSLLDNLMVGRLGTEAMSGVSVVNQFLFIFNLLIFGAVSAAGIFMAQYHGKEDTEGKKYTFRFKFFICALCCVAGVAVLWLFSDQLISLFLKGSSDGGDPVLTLEMGRQYLFIMLIGLLPFSVSNVYASSMRETGDTVTPMTVSLISVATNFVFNYLLIFGSLGFPRLEVRGAAAATVIARTVEMLILVIRTHAKKGKYTFIVGALRSFYIPGRLFRQIIVRGFPLIFNEFFWSMAVTTVNQCYSTRSLDVVAASSIYTTLYNVFSVACLAMGSAISIVVGNLLGAGDVERAKDTDRKMTAFSVFCGVLTGLLMISVAWLFPKVYNTTDSVRELATFMIIISGAMMPFTAFVNAAYFTIRSGGQVIVTVLFDSVFMWVILVPVVFALSRFTGIEIHLLFAIGQITEATKSILGMILLKKGNWARQIVADNKP